MGGNVPHEKVPIIPPTGARDRTGDKLSNSESMTTSEVDEEVVWIEAMAAHWWHPPPETVG